MWTHRMVYGSNRTLYRNDGEESGPDKMKRGVNSMEHGVDGRGLCC